jgi:hypothetical protein
MNTSKVNGLPGGESQKEKSHAVEAGSSRRCVWKAGLQDLRDTAKAKLLEPQYPEDGKVIPRLPHLYNEAIGVPVMKFVSQGISRPMGGENDSLKGTNRVPKSHKFPMHKRGIAYGARALWQRSLRSSLRTGKPSTWRREAGVQDAKIRRYA